MYGLGQTGRLANFLSGKVPESVTDQGDGAWLVDTGWRTESVTLIWQFHLAGGNGQSPRQEEAAARVDGAGSPMPAVRVTQPTAKMGDAQGGEAQEA